jgi:NAD(P)-dependent dehydrogenase (short-subunit alcohol dehydrogenase family)
MNQAPNVALQQSGKLMPSGIKPTELFPGRVSGKVAIVTGGASGIGHGIGRLFASHGARVIIADINDTNGKAAAAQIGRNATFSRHDVGDEFAWEQLIEDVVRREGTLDILVNNAGLGNQSKTTTPDQTTLEDWRAVLKINGEGVFLGCKHAIPAMRDSGGGSIINMSSAAAFLPSFPITAYGFSKAGVAQLTKSVAHYCASKGFGIRCNSIHPGEIKTPMLESLFEKTARQAGIDSEEIRRQFRGAVPLGEFGEPEDVAYAALYLASDEARYVTGIELVVDGGLLLTN